VIISWINHLAPDGNKPSTFCGPLLKSACSENRELGVVSGASKNNLKHLVLIAVAKDSLYFPSHVGNVVSHNVAAALGSANGV
jgi:hypothetical protein